MAETHRTPDDLDAASRLDDEDVPSTVSSPFANARKDAREHSASERLAASAATARPSTASVGTVGLTQADSPDESDAGGHGSQGASRASDRATAHEKLDELDPAGPMPEGAMVASGGRSDHADGKKGADGVDRRWIVAGEIVIAVLLLILVAVLVTLTR